ncbi:hypothetical protein lerEdw1_011714 [Lerista edwardsae]|nr:hypothetical protein lerEdw1_011714 [Lerista edwardsae]
MAAAAGSDAELLGAVGESVAGVGATPALPPEEVARRLQSTRRELSNRRKILLRNLPAESSSQVGGSRRGGAGTPGGGGQAGGDLLLLLLGPGLVGWNWGGEDGGRTALEKGCCVGAASHGAGRTPRLSIGAPPPALGGTACRQERRQVEWDEDLHGLWRQWAGQAPSSLGSPQTPGEFGDPAGWRPQLGKLQKEAARQSHLKLQLKRADEGAARRDLPFLAFVPVKHADLPLSCLSLGHAVMQDGLVPPLMLGRKVSLNSCSQEKRGSQISPMLAGQPGFPAARIVGTKMKGNRACFCSPAWRADVIPTSLSQHSAQIFVYL